MDSRSWERILGTIRLGFHNINGLNFDKKGVKYKQIFNFIKNYEIDSMGLAETHTYWPKVDKKKRLWDKTRGWFEAQNINTAFNKTEKCISTRYQPSGIVSIATKKIAYKVMDKGEDKSLLGRWAWTRFEEKDKRRLRVITLYRSCINGGSRSAYAQQLRWLMKENKSRTPRAALLEDLKAEVDGWRDNGESIIIMGDFNEDVRSKHLDDWRLSMNLREVLLDGLGDNEAPSTHERGKTPIDSIMCSANVQIVNADYLPFGEGAGDHRPLIIDIDEASVLGTAGTSSSKMRARKLKMNDPRVVNKYLSLLNKYYSENNIFRKVYEMNCIPAQYPILPEMKSGYEAIDNIRVAGMRHAEKGCRKFHAGRIQWSPEITAAHNLIELWTLITQRLKNHKVSVRTILRKKKQANYSGDTKVTYDDAMAKLTAAYESYKLVVVNSVDQRNTFINDLAIKKAKAGKVKVANCLMRMQLNE